MIAAFVEMRPHEQGEGDGVAPISNIFQTEKRLPKGKLKASRVKSSWFERYFDKSEEAEREVPKNTASDSIV